MADTTPPTGPILTDEQVEELRKASIHAASIASSYKQAVELQGKMSKDLKGYIDGLKRVKEIEEDILQYAKIKSKLDNDWKNETEKFKKDALKKELNTIESIVSSLEIQKKILIDSSKEIKRSTLLFKDMGKAALQGFSKIPDLIQNGYGKIKSSGLFEMDKAIKTSTLSMGLLSIQSDTFSSNLKAAGMDAAMLGTNFEDLAKINAEYSDALGRNVILGKSGTQAINEMAKGTNLGLEGATKMAAEFENVGLSAENTRDFVEKTMNDASNMGLNASKALKNISSGVKMLNSYNFESGKRGLEKMVLSMTKLGVDMGTIAPMADKLWNIEGAVEMSAQLQVMGGAFASMADPFKLMFQGRNDLKGLTEELAKATSQSMIFGKDGIEMNTMEMSRLKKVAEETSVDYDKLVTMGRNIKKNEAIKTQVVGMTDAEMEFISNVSKFGENGKATIELKSGPKLVSQLDDANKTEIRQMVAQKATLAERAAAAMTFDDSLTGFINGLKQNLLPIVDIMDKKLIPALTDWIKTNPDFIKKIGDVATMIGNFIGSIGKFMIDNPFITLIGFFSTKLAGILGKSTEWFENGIMLYKGFSAASGGVGGGAIGGIGKNSLGGKGNTIGNVENAAVSAVDETAMASKASTVEVSKAASFNMNKVASYATGVLGGIGASVAGTMTGNALYSASGGKTNAGGGWGGAIGGIAGGIGAMLLEQPELIPLFAGLGSTAGSALGNWVGNGFGSGDKVQSMNDGVVQFNKNDKFTKVNDGTMIAGTNVNGNKDLAKALNGNPITSPNQSSNISNNLNVNLSELKISGMIELKLGNNVSREIGDTLLQDPSFIRNISKMINVEIGRAKNIKPA